MSAVHEFAGDQDADIAASQAPAAAIVADRYEVQPGLPLPDLSHPHARAFAARDLQDPDAPVYALVLAPHLPTREAALLGLKGVGRTDIVEPAVWEPTYWPLSDQVQPVLILARPPGRPIMRALGDTIPRVAQRELVDDFMVPLSRVLQELADMRITHRNIRPTNLFRDESSTRVVLGECFSAPAGYAQPTIFEPIERAMAMPSGRGEGGSGDDLYALGVTLLFLLHGTNPMGKLSEAQTIQAKLEVGSYTALTARIRPPTELVEALRGMLMDDPANRWTVKDLNMWLVGTRRSPQRESRGTRADSGFPFAGAEYFSPRALAYAMSQDWQAARAAVQGDTIERWLRLSMKDRQMSEAVAAACHSGGKTSPRMISDDLLTARVLAVLDPAGPLRLRGFSTMPDGVAAAVAATVAEPALGTAFSEMMVGMLPSFWSDHQRDSQPGRLTFQDLGMKLNRILSQKGLGNSVERCLYALNPSLPCLSPRIVAECAGNVTDVLVALDANAEFTEEPPVDRHIAAYLAAHMTVQIERNLNEIAGASKPSSAVLGHLRLLALAQSRHGPRHLGGLCVAFHKVMGPVLDTYRNLPLRKRLKDEAKTAAEHGNLPELLGAVDGDQERDWDRENYAAARTRFEDIIRQIRQLRDSGKRRPALAAFHGHRLAASVSAVLAMMAAAFLILTHTP